MGERVELCGIPTFTDSWLKVKSTSFMVVVRSCRKLLIYCNIGPPIFFLQKLLRRRDCEMLSKAQVTSKRSRVVVSFSFQGACTDSSNRCNACSGDALFLPLILLPGTSLNVLAAQLKRLATIESKVFSMVFISAMERYALGVW